METARDRYLREHSSLPSEALDWIERQTNIRTNYPHMLSGPVQGEFLKMLVQISGAKRILEIGTFTGYSAVCMACGLPKDGHIDALEINDELEDLIIEGWERAGVADKIELRLGDAVETLKSLGGTYDMAFIDANKRQYKEYYDLVLPLMRQGGIILADDVLWDGKVYADPLPQDPQTKGLLTFNDFVASDPRVELVTIPIRDGISIIRKK